MIRMMVMMIFFLGKLHQIETENSRNSKLFSSIKIKEKRFVDEKKIPSLARGTPASRSPRMPKLPLNMQPIFGHRR